MKPWRDIPTMDQWQGILERYHNGELHSYSQGITKFFNGRSTPKDLVELTEMMQAYHNIPKDDHLQLLERANRLETVGNQATAYLNRKVQGSRNWIKDKRGLSEQDKKKFRPAEGYLEREVWRVRMRAIRKREYIVGLHNLYNVSNKFKNLQFCRPTELLERLHKRLSYDTNDELLRIDGSDLLEKMDPLHRTLEFFRSEDGLSVNDQTHMGILFLEWLENDIDAPFFLWLENHPICLGSNTDVWETVDNMTLDRFQSSMVGYDTKKLKSEGKIWMLEPVDSKLRCLDFSMLGFEDLLDGLPLFDTSKIPRDKSLGCKGCAFVVDKLGQIWAGAHSSGSLHHSSLCGGKKVQCAGVLEVVAGVVKVVSGDSGHYKPTRAHVFKFVQMLHDHGVLANDAEAAYWDPTKGQMLEGTCADFLGNKF
jgi:hypothetical protein